MIDHTLNRSKSGTVFFRCYTSEYMVESAVESDTQDPLYIARYFLEHMYGVFLNEQTFEHEDHTPVNVAWVINELATILQNAGIEKDRMAVYYMSSYTNCFFRPRVFRFDNVAIHSHAVLLLDQAQNGVAHHLDDYLAFDPLTGYPVPRKDYLQKTFWNPQALWKSSVRSYADARRNLKKAVI